MPPVLSCAVKPEHQDRHTNCRCIAIPGSWIVHASEQSGKTGAKAGLAVVCSHLQVPLVIIIKDVKGNAEKVADDLESLLKPFDISVCYVSGRNVWTAVCAMAGSRFQEGKLVLVMSAHTNDLNEFLATKRIAGDSLLGHCLSLAAAMQVLGIACEIET